MSPPADLAPRPRKPCRPPVMFQQAPTDEVYVSHLFLSLQLHNRLFGRIRHDVCVKEYDAWLGGVACPWVGCGHVC